MPPVGNIQLGRLGRLFAMAESTYSTAPVITATQAVRHLNAELSFNRFKYTNANDRFRTPEVRRRTQHEAEAGFDIKSMAMWPSGTIGTAPEADALLLNAFGAKHAAALTTTIASSPTSTGATLTSGTGLQVGDMALINVTGDKRRAVRLQTVAGAVVTWTPALTVVPTVADTFKTGTTYSPGTELASSIYLAHYLVNNGVTFSREILGGVVDTFGFTLEQAQEPLMNFAGPAQFQNRPSSQSEPGAFTTVGTALPTGMTASVIVGASTAAKIKKIVTTIKNNEVVRIGEMGKDRASDYYRKDQREVTLVIDAFVEDPTIFYALGESGAPTSIFIQIGFTEGQVWAFYYPSVSIEIPQTPDGDNELNWSFKGMALGTVGNDECYVANL
jgi:hypothetical protein